MSQRRFLAIYALLCITFAGCAAPRSISYYGSFADYSTFTCVPYSALMGDTTLAGQSENAMLYSLVNEIMGKGYEYTPFVDSADFIATVIVRNTFDPSSTLVALSPPDYHAVVPFSIIFQNSGSWGWPTAYPGDSSPNVNPEVNAILYAGRDSTAHHAVLRNWVGGAAMKASNLSAAGQYVLDRFMQEIPFCTTFNNETFGSGASGLAFTIRARDGIHFWPEVTRVVKDYPAEQAGIQLGDEILEVNGHQLENLNLRDCLRLFKGDAGKRLDLTVWRYPATTFDVTYTLAARK